MNTTIKKSSNFTHVQNEILRDDRISFKAKGLFCYMFSMKSDWNFTIQSIATQQNEGKSSVTSALNELKQFGYIQYTKHQNGFGTYLLDDNPQNPKTPLCENPIMRKSDCIKNNQLDKNTITNSDSFEKLWIAYRKVGSKSLSKKKYLSKSFKVSDKDILLAINRYLATVKDKAYQKHFSTFLNSISDWLEDYEQTENKQEFSSNQNINLPSGFELRT